MSGFSLHEMSAGRIEALFRFGVVPVNDKAFGGVENVKDATQRALQSLTWRQGGKVNNQDLYDAREQLAYALRNIERTMAYHYALNATESDF